MGRIEAARQRLEGARRRMDARARERRARFAELDGQLREAVEKREVPRPARRPMPEPGTLPDEVAVLADDGQLRRAENLLANLTGAGVEEARTAVAAYLLRRPRP